MTSTFLGTFLSAAQDAAGKVLGPDFWETTRAVAPIVGGAVAMATFYLRSVIRNENGKQMNEIRALFATQKELGSLKELLTSEVGHIVKRMDMMDLRKT